MDIRFIILPGVLLAIHTIFILFKMAGARQRAASSGKIDVKYFRTYQGYDVPENLILWNRHYNNLLELPILYYFAILVAISLQLINMVNVILVWSYLLLRLLHSVIHLKGNKVKNRFRIFALSAFVLLALWLSILYSLLAGWV